MTHVGDKELISGGPGMNLRGPGADLGILGDPGLALVGGQGVYTPTF